MKKIIFIIFLFCIFVFYDKVYAQESAFSGAEFLNGVSYVKFDGSYYHYRNAQVIRNLDTGNVAYCIEPFSSLIDGTVYNGYENYDSVFNLTEEEWERVKLLAHYGYGYKGHSDDKWITITQFLIWRTVDSNSTFNWIDNVYDKNIIYPYENEINELNKLVEKHYVLPSFPDKSKMFINSTLELIDSNNVLDKYEIVYSDFDYYIAGNKLVINSTDKMLGKIKFKMKQFLNNGVQFFYANNTQSVVESGNVDPIYFEIDIEVVSGSLKIKKVDKDTQDVIPYGKASLIGASYKVLNEIGELVGTIVIGEDNYGVLENLPLGNYSLREEKAGTGYFLDDRPYKFSITLDNYDINMTLSNEVRFKLIKKYGTIEDYRNGTLMNEVGIGFNFYNEDNELIYTYVTDENGVIEFLLPYGTYLVKQINTTPGYDMAKDATVIIDEKSSYSYTLTLTDLKIDVPNASVYNSFYDKVMSLFGIVLYDNGNN